MRASADGFTLVEVMIVVMIIGLLAAFAMPSFAKARTLAQANTCINNLRQIESAKDQYALDNGLVGGTAISESDLLGYLKKSPECPVKGVYDYGSVIDSTGAGQFASCSSYDAVTHPATLD